MTAIELPDGEYTAVVDGIEDGLARVFFEQDDEEKGNAVLEADALPDSGQHADTILSVTIEDGTIETATYQPAETADRETKAQDRFDSLSERPPSKDDETEN
ncbi:DUF3006 domain-containing protein [Halonotius sp. GCM10025705]|uniref:DUF3006 domain-containing protein n=1 Tax=Halonotius sp. GCM10025705 TaxID=3252678 RepID=UPI00361B276D